MTKRPEPIRVGDKFQTPDGVLEVIEMWPGGQIDLFDRERSRAYHLTAKQLRGWQRFEPRYIRVGDLWQEYVSLDAMHAIRMCLNTPSNNTITYTTDGVTDHGNAPELHKRKRKPVEA